MIVITVALASFTLISYIGGHETLFCTHEVLNVAYVNPSTYCQITGTQVCSYIVMYVIAYMCTYTYIAVHMNVRMYARSYLRT